MATPAQLKANAKHLSTLDSMIIRVPKDGTKARYKAHAEAQGKSLNAYVVDLIEEDIAKHIVK